jgi:hypothetical protein
MGQQRKFGKLSNLSMHLYAVGQRSIVVIANNSYRGYRKPKTCHRKFVVRTHVQLGNKTSNMYR